jgi:transposase
VYNIRIKKITKKEFPYSYNKEVYNKGMNKEKVVKTMSIDKAVKIINDYKKNNFNAYKTLIQNGYSESSALKQAKRTIDNAKDKIDNALQLKDKDLRQTSEIVSDLYSVVGITREDVLKEYQSIVKQNINLAVKLRALEPLIHQEGIKWNDKEEQKAPSIVIKVDEVHNHTEVDSQ